MSKGPSGISSVTSLRAASLEAIPSLKLNRSHLDAQKRMTKGLEAGRFRVPLLPSQPNCCFSAGCRLCVSWWLSDTSMLRWFTLVTGASFSPRKDSRADLLHEAYTRFHASVQGTAKGSKDGRDKNAWTQPGQAFLKPLRTHSFLKPFFMALPSVFARTPSCSL